MNIPDKKEANPAIKKDIIIPGPALLTTLPTKT